MYIFLQKGYIINEKKTSCYGNVKYFQKVTIFLDFAKIELTLCGDNYEGSEISLLFIYVELGARCIA